MSWRKASPPSSRLKVIEAICSSEMLVTTYKTTCCHNPEHHCQYDDFLDLPYCCEQWTSSSCCLFLGKMVNMATDPLIVPTRRCSGSSWLDTRGHAIEVTHASCVSMWQSSPVTATFGPSARHSGVNTFKI
jgi:hypothetical protein